MEMYAEILGQNKGPKISHEISQNFLLIVEHSEFYENQ